MFLHNEVLFGVVVVTDHLGVLNALDLNVDQFLLEVLLLFLHVLHLVLVVLVLLDLGTLAVPFDIHVGFFLLVLKQFQFLQKHLHLSVVTHLHVLPLGLLVKHLSA